ncbi:MAG: helix-turn-helix transcriptional regulator [Bacteroidales bacterium]|jgi:AraC-like DNA-binding protein|nr:helix-turn-helix transcriptional regulator [Bacteroidales bacterium]
MIIEFKIDKFDTYLIDIAKQFNTSIVNNTVILPEDIGNGMITYINFNDQFILSFFEFSLNQSAKIIRKKSDNCDILPLLFWLSNSEIVHEPDTSKNYIGKDEPNGIFFLSNNIETSYFFPANRMIKNVSIIVSKKWLKENVSKNNNYLNRNVLLDNPSFIMFESIHSDMLAVSEKINDIFQHKNEYSIPKLKLNYLSLELLTMFFDKLLNRNLEKHDAILNQSEIVKMFTVRKILSGRFIEIPSIDAIAQEIGMNKRKIQKYFKQIFGLSVYQYALSVKMNEAKKLLTTKKYSVSEVGYLVGYSNLSHFTETFKKQFGSTPKRYISSI